VEIKFCKHENLSTLYKKNNKYVEIIIFEKNSLFAKFIYATIIGGLQYRNGYIDPCYWSNKNCNGYIILITCPLKKS
jgi:hypothetical protein